MKSERSAADHGHHSWRQSMTGKHKKREEVIEQLRARVREMKLRNQDPSEFIFYLQQMGVKP